MSCAPVSCNKSQEAAWKAREEFMRCAYYDVASNVPKSASKIISDCDEQARWPQTTKGK